MNRQELVSIPGDIEAKAAPLYYKLVDLGKSFPEPFGKFTEADEEDIENQFPNVESPKVFNIQEAINPLGQIDNLSVVCISDTQYSESPERIRGNVFAISKAINFFRVLGYKLSEIQAKEVFEAVANYPQIYEEAKNALYEKSDIQELPESLKMLKDNEETSGMFKQVWNILAVVKYELEKHPTSRKLLTETIDKISEKTGNDVFEWFRSGIWQARGAISDYAIDRIISQASENLPEDTNLLALDAGDTVATSGTKSDFIHAKTNFMRTLAQVPSAARKIFMKGLGNQDSDGREPDVIDQLFMFHGGMAFAQEIINPKGDSVLYASLNSSFFSSQDFYNVLISAMKNKQFHGKEDQILRTFDRYLAIQSAVINRINSHKGEIVISVHNPRQFELATKGEKPLISPQNGKIVQVVSGHPHENRDYDITIDSSTAHVTCFSGYPDINADSVVLPQGAKITIRDGKTTVERVVPNRVEFTEKFGVPFVNKRQPTAL